MSAAIYFGKGNAHEKRQNRGCSGRPSWRSSFLGDPGAKFLCGKLAIGKKKEKRSKKKEMPVGTVGGNKSFTGGTNGLEKNECLTDRVCVGFWASVGS